MTAPVVVDITVERERALVIEYDDGVVCEFPLRELRAACPCAACQGWRQRGEVAWPRPGDGDGEGLRIEVAELAGAWGISLTWSDGHSTGIYPWDSLRRWHDGTTDGLTADA
jgi:DUF971 family protein